MILGRSVNLQNEYVAEREKRIKDLGTTSLQSFYSRVSKLERELNELQLAKSMQGLAYDVTKSPETRIIFNHVDQSGLTCVATSLVNGLRFMGEQRVNSAQNVHKFIKTFLTNTPSPHFGSEERMLEDARAFLCSTEGRSLLYKQYALNLTASLIEIVGNIVNGNPALAIYSGHCVLAHHIERRGKPDTPTSYLVQIADPLQMQVREIPIDEFQKLYLSHPLYDVVDRLKCSYVDSSQRPRVKLVKSSTFDINTAQGILEYITTLEKNDKIGIGVRAGILERV